MAGLKLKTIPMRDMELSHRNNQNTQFAAFSIP